MAAQSHGHVHQSFSTEKDKEPATVTSEEQDAVEKRVTGIYRVCGKNKVHLLREKHISYLKKGLVSLSDDYQCLDASRPWLCYWIIHSLSLMDYTIPPSVASNVVEFLRKCQSSTGGFGGGPGQLPHLAPTYAAVLTLCEIGTQESYNAIDRVSLQRFLYSLLQPDGSFVMHVDGEVDIRGVYCAAVVAYLTNIASPELFLHSGEWIASCQTYEGGFSAVPGAEAHGGYSYCGYAAAILLQKHHLVDHKALLKWASRRQMAVEGGFQGRTNKLVDSCYSFWVGGIFPLVYLCLKQLGDQCLPRDSWHFDQNALQKYVMYCCQNYHGGLFDKPGKSRDYYHTCYSLSGISLSQHCFSKSVLNICGDDSSLLVFSTLDGCSTDVLSCTCLCGTLDVCSTDVLSCTGLWVHWLYVVQVSYLCTHVQKCNNPPQRIYQYGTT